ncbi:hypothetical protein PSEUBRA_001846 [Kalmanozyma brasiliensis GHG001]|uniref:Ricin B lectin domain-containing protein n=1 Tax=Kalmanozyma brasiliensis (strain GHG001) TaxID=1365824 RepID=V5EXV4_KALBG|nr:uncharacterized protein PSEUBRA_001846 [Kalmanozyma brasiliensis GHG001]EST08433.1 hypothetical protein PSEUBRA_001846 [Kalmanozyma brasiliensis GHG001]
MRFSTATTLSALLAIGSVSASVLPRVLDNYDLAQPVAFEQREVAPTPAPAVEEREVPILQCAETPIKIGQLKLASASGREVSAAFEGLRNADGFQKLDVQKAGQSARFENFAFTACNSTFLGYLPEANKAAEVTYGRLQPAHLVGRRCVSADKLATADGRLIAAKCDPSDDSVQLTQFWSLTKQPAAEADKWEYYVNFLGSPAGETPDFPGSYTLSLAHKGANKLVQLNHSDEPGRRSAYYLKLDS